MILWMKSYLVHKAGKVGDHVFVVTGRHGLDFFQQLVHGRVPLFQIDAFDGALFISWLAIGGVNYCGGSDPNHISDFVFRGAVGPRGLVDGGGGGGGNRRGRIVGGARARVGRVGVVGGEWRPRMFGAGRGRYLLRLGHVGCERRPIGLGDKTDGQTSVSSIKER